MAGCLWYRLQVPALTGIRSSTFPHIIDNRSQQDIDTGYMAFVLRQILLRENLIISLKRSRISTLNSPN